MGIIIKTAASALALVGIAAHADTIRTFDINGASVFYGMAGDQNIVTGTVIIDTTTGVVQNIYVVAGGSFVVGVYAQQGLTVYIGTPQSKISFDAGTLQDYMGSTFDLNGPNDLYVGHITPAALALTPEPSSLLFFTTGLIGVAAAARRRLYFSAQALPLAHAGRSTAFATVTANCS